MGKNAISPLIATVIIIGFVVALAAILFTWGQSFIKSMKERSEEKAKLDLLCTEINRYIDIKNLCVEAASIDITITNSGNKKIEGFDFLIEGKIDRDYIKNQTGLNAGEIRHYKLYWKAKKIGIPKLISFIPLVKLDEEVKKCTQRIEKEIRECVKDITKDVWGTLYDAKESGAFKYIGGGGEPKWVEGLGGGEALDLSVGGFKCWWPFRS